MQDEDANSTSFQLRPASARPPCSQPGCSRSHSIPQATHVAWVSMDESDNDPVQFWTYALTALDRQQPGLCTPLLGYLHTQQAPTPPLRYILQALINALVSSTE